MGPATPLVEQHDEQQQHSHQHALAQRHTSQSGRQLDPDGTTMAFFCPSTTLIDMALMSLQRVSKFYEGKLTASGSVVCRLTWSKHVCAGLHDLQWSNGLVSISNSFVSIRALKNIFALRSFLHSICPIPPLSCKVQSEPG